MLNTYLLLNFKALRKPPVTQELPHPSICTIIAIAKRDFLRGVRCTIYIKEVFLNRHIRDRRPGKTACPTVWAWRQMNWNSVGWGRKNFVEGQLEQARQNKSLLYRHDEPNDSAKEGSRSFIPVLIESPFASVSTVNRIHPSVVSLLLPKMATYAMPDLSYDSLSTNTRAGHFQLKFWKSIIDSIGPRYLNRNHRSLYKLADQKWF